MTHTTKKTELTNADAIAIGDMLGYIEMAARRSGRRFYAYLKGEIKHWKYDETVHYGDITKYILPVIDFLVKRDYYVPVLNA